MVLFALDWAVWVFKSRVMAEPAGVPVVFAVGATKVERWVGLDVAAVVSGLDCLTFTAVFAGVGAGAVACRLVELELKEPNPPLGFEGAGAAAVWAGAEGLELEEPNEPKLLLGLLEDEELEREELDELEELDFPASATVGPIARAKLSIAMLSSEIRDLFIGVL